MGEADAGKFSVEGTFRAANVILDPPSARALERWVALLVKWNAKINLTAVRDPASIVELHLLDSAFVAADVAPGDRVVDVGSGAGLPGLVVAILVGEARVTLVEPNAKKVAFLRAAVDALSLANVTVQRTDLAALPVGTFDRAVSRALMAPAEWLAAARPLVRSGGHVGIMVARDSDLPALEFAQIRRMILPSDRALRLLAWVRVV